MSGGRGPSVYGRLDSGTGPAVSRKDAVPYTAITKVKGVRAGTPTQVRARILPKVSAKVTISGREGGGPSRCT